MNEFQDLITTPGVTIASHGGICPFQAAGYIDDYPFYMRNRNGYSLLAVGAPGSEHDDYVSYSDRLWSASLNDDEVSWSGKIDSTYARIFDILVSRLGVQDFLWHFPGRDIIYDASQPDAYRDNGRMTYSGFGLTPDIAYLNATQPRDSWMVDVPDDVKVAMREVRNISQNPVNSDTRRFPVNPPRFINPTNN